MEEQFILNEDENVVCLCGHPAIRLRKREGYMCGTVTAYPCKYTKRKNTDPFPKRTVGERFVQLIKSCGVDSMKNRIKPNSIDLIFADIPYGTTNAVWDSPLDLKEMWEGINRVKKNNNTPILLFAQAPFDKVLGVSNIKELRYEWIWEKPHATGHFNAKKMPMKAHENILVFYSQLPLYNPQKTTGHTRKVASAKSRLASINRADDKSTYIYGKMGGAGVEDYDSTERYPRSVLKFSSDTQKGSKHPNQKPVELLRYFIRTYTNPGDTILDFTMGSGSTGEASILEGRNFIGIEKYDITDAQFFTEAVDRLQPLCNDNGYTFTKSGIIRNRK